VGDLLTDKRVLLTGGSRGLGRALACAVAAEGARVCFTYRKNQDAAAETLAAVQALGRAEARAEQVSVLDTSATTALIKSLESEWGGLDVLVNNAGITQNLPLALLEEEDWDRVMDTNVKGTFLTTRAVLRGMIRRKQGGTVLCIGSLAGVRTLDAPIHYCASKAALVGFTRALSKEVARYRIRVNCLAPGLLEGGIGVKLPDHRLADYLKHCSLGRLGEFSEVARLAAFMVSERCSYLSGETIVMDGGL
jgi:3-oxoacyl-[acyl-carrier protein] reductase